MRQLWGHIDTPLAKRWQWALLVQRMRSLSQNERPEQTPHQTKAKTGKFKALS